MKKLILIAVLILSCQLLTCQGYEFGTYLKIESSETTIYDFKFAHQTKQEKLVPWQITAVAIFAVTTEAIGDGLYDQGKQDGNQNQMMFGKILQAISLGSHFLYIPIMKNSNTHWLWIPAIEMGWRIIGFDPVYNLARSLPIGHIGNTSYWDRGLQAFNPPLGIQMFGRAIIMTATISITFDKF